MSSAQQAGEYHGQAQAKTEQMADSAKSTAHSMADKAENATQSAQESVQQNKDQNNPGFLQQTGEQVINMAQGAVDGVKNTLGIGSDKK
ncbi:late embryogenesis abundant protein 1-like [Lycium barbarum]|uniref:late embryogenesis abundant protein 1-like n=1 Tax=Lycium ferocissimum TaxID=112874 RepID=UPI0028151489|nr:late embryogenesis abundant protein 1-like [Lycium ferocissimum]XP_060180483.1 late embryogenesis abundant protein 1-like [Lycium barbarum]